MTIVNSINLEDVPFYKRISDSSITVDCFNIDVKGCTHYFLSHFHADHYTKLKRSFQYPIYCSKTTANLVKSQIGCNSVGLEMYINYNFDNFVVRLIEANHCPGAVVFIFLINNQFILHTGDFRYNKKYHTFNMKFRWIYLDNTYESYLNFPSQNEVINKILCKFDQKNILCPLNICVLCCTYKIGKEKVFLSIAEYLNQKIQVTAEKMKIYKCYSKYTVDLLNKEVLDIVNKRKQFQKTYGIQKHIVLNQKFNEELKPKKTRKKETVYKNEELKIVSHSNPEIDLLNSIRSPNSLQDNQRMVGKDITNKLKIDGQEKLDLNSDILPFDRLTLEDAPIKIISMSNMSRLDTIISKIYADKIIILCGSGWKEKEVYKNFKRFDGKTIKNGIEIVYFRYSEHSSSQELEVFKNESNYVELINTVKNF